MKIKWDALLRPPLAAPRGSFGPVESKNINFHQHSFSVASVFTNGWGRLSICSCTIYHLPAFIHLSILFGPDFSLLADERCVAHFRESGRGIDCVVNSWRTVTLLSKRIKNNGGKRIIWRRRHYESKTSGQQKHRKELFHSIPLRSTTIVGREKALLLLSS